MEVPKLAGGQKRVTDVSKAPGNPLEERPGAKWNSWGRKTYKVALGSSPLRTINPCESSLM